MRATPSDSAIQTLENRMAIVPREVLEIGIEIDDRHGAAAGDIMRRALDDPFFVGRTVTPRALRNALSRVPPPVSAASVPPEDLDHLRRIVARWTRAGQSDRANLAAVSERCATTLDALGIVDYDGLRRWMSRHDTTPES